MTTGAPTVDDVAQWAGISQRTPTVDALLAECLTAADAQVAQRLGAWIGDDWTPYPDIVLAVTMQTTRLYKRRSSPEGLAGFGDLGVVRVTSFDPDIEGLLNPYLAWSFGGVLPVPVVDPR